MAYRALHPMTLLGKRYSHNEVVDISSLPLRKVASLVRVGYLVEMPDTPVRSVQQTPVEEVDVSQDAVCGICGSAFKNETGLSIHMSRKHEEGEPEDG